MNACAHVCFVHHNNDIHKARLSCRSVGLGLGICAIEHLSGIYYYYYYLLYQLGTGGHSQKAQPILDVYP